MAIGKQKQKQKEKKKTEEESAVSVITCSSSTVAQSTPSSSSFSPLHDDEEEEEEEEEGETETERIPAATAIAIARPVHRGMPRQEGCSKWDEAGDWFPGLRSCTDMAGKEIQGGLPVFSRRDVGTQMTPLGSSRVSQCNSPSPSPNPSPSPSRRSRSSRSPARHNSPAAPRLRHLLQLESCRNHDRERDRDCTCLHVSHVKKYKEHKVVDARLMAAWQEAELAKLAARYKQEEAKIQAWENHEKAKAEAKLKKLEVKLEKMRAIAIEKMMNKLALASKRAEEMRATTQAKQLEKIMRTRDKVTQIGQSENLPFPTFTSRIIGLSNTFS